MSFWAGNVGTETSGSILSPANANMLAGIKPTVGRISRWGVIPITGDQDTAGPMTRTVTDAAIMMGALECASPDPNDAATNLCEPPANGDPLLDYEGKNLIVTPHIAWATNEARQAAIDELTANIVAFQEGQKRNRIV